MKTGHLVKTQGLNSTQLAKCNQVNIISCLKTWRK